MPCNKRTHVRFGVAVLLVFSSGLQAQQLTDSMLPALSPNSRAALI